MALRECCPVHRIYCVQRSQFQANNRTITAECRNELSNPTQALPFRNLRREALHTAKQEASEFAEPIGHLMLDFVHYIFAGSSLAWSRDAFKRAVMIFVTSVCGILTAIYFGPRRGPFRRVFSVARSHMWPYDILDRSVTRGSLCRSCSQRLDETKLQNPTQPW